jgi:uncharacterized membrane protein YfcA
MTLVIFLVCLAASIVGAVSGIGGGVIIKPVMDSFGTFSVTTINFLTSCTVFSMTAVTMIRNRKSAIALDKRIGTLLAIGGVFGGLAGKWIFDWLKKGFGNDTLVGAAQYVVLTVLTLAVLIFVLNKQRFTPKHCSGGVTAFTAGLFLGAMASFLGIGGGPINLAVLYLLFAMDSKTAALNSIYIILFSQAANILLTLVQDRVPQFDPLLLALMVAGGIGGGLSGSWLTKRLSLKGVDRLFCAVMAVIIVISIYNFIRFIG